MNALVGNLSVLVERGYLSSLQRISQTVGKIFGPRVLEREGITEEWIIELLCKVDIHIYLSGRNIAGVITEL